MAKDYYDTVSAKAGFAGEYEALTESEIAVAPGGPYVPGEEGVYRAVASRVIQLLRDSPVYIETFQTSAATIRVPTGAIGTNDAEDGRFYFIKNSGTANISLQKSDATVLGVLNPLALNFVFHGDNDDWDVVGGPSGPAGGDLAGTYPNPTVHRSSTEFALTGVISPALITANQNDYNPTGLSSATTLRLTADAPRSVTGLAGGISGRVIVFMNVGSFPITFVKESALSIAANRFTLNGSVTLVTDATLTLIYDATSSRWRSTGGGGGGGGGVGALLQSQWIEVDTNTSTTATTWPVVNTTIAVLSNGVTLPTGTINAASTAGFPTAGKLVVLVAGTQSSNIVSYTGTTATTFTGCTGGTGTLQTGAKVYFYLTTTIAAGSNGVGLPTGTINIASTTGFPASGTLLVTTSNNTQLVSYTGTTATTFTGCTGGTGTMSTGGLVINVTTTLQDLLRISGATNGGAIVLQAMGCASNAANNQVVFFRVVVDGIVYHGGSTKSNGGSGVTAFVLSLKLYDLLAGDHVIQLQWSVSAGTGQVRPITTFDENASLLLQEVSS